MIDCLGESSVTEYLINADIIYIKCYAFKNIKSL